MINGYSRYANAKIELLQDASHTAPRPTIIPIAPYLRIFNYTEYESQYGDRVDNISFKFFNDPSLWWKIADANPEILLWTELEPGTILRIPNVV